MQLHIKGYHGFTWVDTEEEAHILVNMATNRHEGHMVEGYELCTDTGVQISEFALFDGKYRKVEPRATNIGNK